MKKILGLILILFSSFLFAQEDENYYSVYVDENVMDFIFHSRPMVEINYGYGIPKNKKVVGEFGNIGNWDLRLGMSEQKNFKGALIDLSERFTFGSYLASTAQNFQDNTGKIGTEIYRFGIGTRDGYGIGGSFFAIVPYVSQSFVWTKLAGYDSTGLSLNDRTVLNDYLGTFRFGDKSSFGLKAELFSRFQVNAYYETSVVYRRHLFWYWSGSFLVSQIGYNALSYFADQLVDNSPVLGGIFNFLLKAGYLYGYYLVRQENMNWPFNMDGNEAPLTFETVNVGFSFLF